MFDRLELVAFGPQHLEAALRLSREALWPHRREDWEMGLALSEGVVAVVGREQVVGTVLVTPYEGAATINMVIVDAAHRGRGLGRKLMDAALAIAGDRPLRLTATREARSLYQSLGFRVTDTVLQHQGEGKFVARPSGVSPVEPSEIPVITRLDREAFGADREGLIAHIAGVGRFAALRGGGKLIGFAALRAFGLGEIVGPVVAPGLDEAKALISFFIAERPRAFLRIDTTATSGLAPWLEEQGLAVVGSGLAMQRPVIPVASAPGVKTFALANQALG